MERAAILERDRGESETVDCASRVRRRWRAKWGSHRTKVVVSMCRLTCEYSSKQFQPVFTSFEFWGRAGHVFGVWGSSRCAWLRPE